MKKYIVSISVQMTSKDIEELGLLNNCKTDKEKEEKIRETLGDILFEAIEDMVLGRTDFDFELKMVK